MDGTVEAYTYPRGTAFRRVASDDDVAPETGPTGPSAGGESPSARLTLSVIVPVYNEESTIAEALCRVLSVPGVTQVIVVDDGSTDRSLARAKKIAARDSRIEILCHPANRGKGAAVRSAIPLVREPLVVTQDADLECDPQDLRLMLDRFSDPNVHVVYGVREASVRRAWKSLYGTGSWLITWATNRLYGTRLADEPTCYKMLRSPLLRRGMSLMLLKRR